MANDPHNKDIDQLSGVETTGHDWDGIKELNHPAPRWWLWVFYACILYAVGYWFVYPAWPTLSDHTEGKWGWTEYAQLKEQRQEVVALREKYGAALDAASLQDIKNKPDLYAFAMAGGAAAFKDNCAACHGTGAQGGKGFPNLTDDDWLWGGSLDQISATIHYGARSGHAKMHDNTMPAFGKDAVLKPEEIEAVAAYVEKLSDGEAAVSAPAFEQGKKIFADNCVACHGDQGQGNIELGGPRLNDKIWLNAPNGIGVHDMIVAQLNNPKMGVMPTWEGRLNERTIKQLAVYVHELGGGK